MSLHVPKFILALSKPKPADAFSFKFCGMTVKRAFARLPRVHRLVASRPVRRADGSIGQPEGA